MRTTLAVIFFILANPVFASEPRWTFNLEAGAAIQTTNDVQIPPDDGTRFSLVDAVGKGPVPYARFEAKYAFNDRHRIRLLLAPLVIEDKGRLSKEVFYDGNTFAANTETTYRYQFNSYRLSYAYRFFASPSWNWDIGFTAKIRDAEIALKQGNVESGYPNLGFVPLLHLAAEKDLNSNWRIQMDLDAAGSPQGRAIDFGLFLNYALTDAWRIGAGYRTIEGGADVDKVYNFAWLHYFGAQLQVSF